MKPHPLRSARIRAGWSQRQLADAMPTAPAVLSRVESGKTVPTAAWLLKAARALGIDPRMLGVDDLRSTRDDLRSSNGTPGPSLPPPDPPGLVITLVIDRAPDRKGGGVQDDPHRLTGATAADLVTIAGLGQPARLDVHDASFRQLLTLAANRRIDVLIRYDRGPLMSVLPLPAKATAPKARKARVAR